MTNNYESNENVRVPAALSTPERKINDVVIYRGNHVGCVIIMMSSNFKIDSISTTVKIDDLLSAITQLKD